MEMTMASFFESAGFATVLTALVTTATCIITYVQGLRKIKIEKFREVYDCLQKFSERKLKMIRRCNKLAEAMADKIPEDMTDSAHFSSCYRSVYHDFQNYLLEYSQYLESLISFYSFLYKDKYNIPSVAEDCREVLRLYALFTGISVPGAEDYRLKYHQIATIIQFLKMYTGLRGKIGVYRYLKNNDILNGRASRFAKAFL